MSDDRQLLECPKHMTYGPCGGVDFDGSCEVSPHPCVFLDLPTVRWHGIERDSAPVSSRAAEVNEPLNTASAERMRDLLNNGRVVVADLPARALDARSIEECAAPLAGRVDAVLAGDAGNARVQFSPTFRAHLIREAGLEVWTGLNCRDRNRVALEGEFAGLAEVGVAAVHCVTGDHTFTGSRPDALPVFDLDSTELASLARAAGHLVSVGESPATPPIARRSSRLLEKVNSGAEVCFVNHCGGVEPVREFIRQSGDLLSAPFFIACVPVVVDRASAELLRSFTTLVLPDGYLDRILDAADPFAEGIAAAVELSRDLLEIDGVCGVNLSGGTDPGRELWFAEALGTISERLRR